MPLPDILKRRRTQPVNNEASQANQNVIGNKRPQKLPLEDIEIETAVVASSDDDANFRLVTTLEDILLKNVALGYFLQYLDHKDKGSLLKFWLDVSSFKAASLLKQADQPVLSPGQDSLDSGIHTDWSSSAPISKPNLTNMTEDAVQIYQRYVSPDCPYPIDLSLDQKQDIVRGICTEDGQIESSCFDAAIDNVVATLENQFYVDFLSSPFYAKYQLEVFACDGGVTIQGILNTDVLLFHFMEFMESEGKSELAMVEFWMMAKHFKAESRQTDAMLIYEKFISLQASSPLGFSSKLRSRIEESICAADGQVKSDCFDESIKAVEVVLQRNYLKAFLNSALFAKYFTGLITLIEKAGVASNQENANSSNIQRQRSASGSSMNTTCSSETLSSSTHNISVKNTLLATASVRKKRRKSPDFLDRTNEPDFLWRRHQSVLTNIGHVDHLGRYVSSLDLPPDTAEKKQVLIEPNMKARISKAVKKMITNEDVERVKEEMAWQMAELVITDVINRSKFPPESDEDALSTLGAPCTPSKTASALSRHRKL